MPWGTGANKEVPLISVELRSHECPEVMTDGLDKVISFLNDGDLPEEVLARRQTVRLSDPTAAFPGYLQDPSHERFEVAQSRLRIPVRLKRP